MSYSSSRFALFDLESQCEVGLGLGGCNERVGAVRRSCLKCCCLMLLPDGGQMKLEGIVTRGKVVASTIPT